MPRAANYLKLLLESSAIPKPWYALTGEVSPPNDQILVKNIEDIVKIREACKAASAILSVLLNLARNAKATFSASVIDLEMHKQCWKHCVYPSSFNYGRYPHSLCVSVNHEVCHGMPSRQKQLRLGDLVSIDLTVYNGYHGDVCGTVIVGGDKHATEDSRNLIDATRRARDEAIRLCKPGSRLSELAVGVERVAKESGLRVIPNVCGHGVGIEFHEAPRIAFHSPAGVSQTSVKEEDCVLQSGMVITIEPALTVGSGEVELNNYENVEDDWTIVTSDGTLCAQFEHTVLITDSGAGYEILTA